jgi:large repetitive protein
MINRLLIIGILCFLSQAIEAQVRLVFADDVYANIAGADGTDNIFMVIDNGNPNAITLSGSQEGGIISEGEYNRVKWNIGNQTGDYYLPFRKNTLNTPVGFNLNITTPGDAAGYFLFSTFPTNAEDAPWPNDVNNIDYVYTDGLPEPGYVSVDRFYILEPNFTTTPSATLLFEYLDEEIAAPNTIIEENLRAHRFNPVADSWEQMLWGEAGPGTNVVLDAVIDQADLFRSWTLVPCEEPEIIEILLENSSCYGADDGVINISVTGGANPYQYSIDNGLTFQVDSVFENLAPGDYDIVVRELNGCQVIDLVTLTEPDSLFFEAEGVDLLCFEDGSGEIEFTDVQGGTPPFESSIDGGITFNMTVNYTDLVAGEYVLVVQDANGCESDTTITLDQPDELEGQLVSQDVSCFEGEDGVIAVDATGGTPDYAYSIDGGQTSQALPVFEALPAGDYEVLVMDDNACELILEVTLLQPDELVIEILTDSVSCFGGTDGAIVIDAQGGTPTYEYSIDGGVSFQTNQNFTDLTADTYSVVVTDANDCEVTAVVVVNEPPLLTLEATSEDISCFGFNDGEIEMNAQGGTPNYEYSIDNGVTFQSSGVFNGLAPNQYDVQVRDENGCTAEQQLTITEPTQLTLDFSGVDITCFGQNNGQINLQADGGTPAYSFSIDGGSNFLPNASYPNLPPGTYDVMVRDDNGCEVSGQLMLQEPDELIFTVSNDTTICTGTEIEITAQVQGGTTPYTYNWSSGLGNSSSHIVNPTVNSVYTVGVTDANDCQAASQTILVEIYPLLDALVIGPAVDVCEGTEVNISVFVLSGQEPYTFDWTNDDDPSWTSQQSSVVYEINGNTQFTVVINDFCNNPIAEVVEVGVLPQYTPDFVLTSPSGCFPHTTEFVNATPPNQIGGNCFWDFGDGNYSMDCSSVTHTYSSPGCYDVTLTIDSPDGCSGSRTYTDMVCVGGFPIADFEADPSVTDVFNTTVSFENMTMDGQFYEWDFSGLDMSFEMNPVYEFPGNAATTYQVCLTAINEYGCSDTICKPIVVQDDYTIYVPNAFTPNGDGTNEFFGPIIYGYRPKEFQFLIYNRWGELVFESVNPESMWDGMYRGQMAQQGVYVWKIYARNASTAEAKEYVGHVTLLR